MLCYSLTHTSSVADCLAHQTSTFHNIADDMCMGDFPTHTPSAISIGFIFNSRRGHLIQKSFGFSRTARVWIGFKKTREVVDVTAGEANERFFLCEK